MRAASSGDAPASNAMVMVAITVSLGNWQLRRAQEQTELQGLLESSIVKQFELELSRSQEKLTGAISPYTRFVGAELEHLHDLKAELERTAGDIEGMRREVEALR